MTWTQVAAQGGSRTVITGAVVFGTETHCVFAGDSSLQKPDGAGGWTQVAAAAATNTYRGDSPFVYSGSLYAVLKAPAAGITTAGRLYQLSAGAWSTTNTPVTTVALATMNGTRAFCIRASGDLEEYVGTTSYTVRSATPSPNFTTQAIIGFGSNVWVAVSDSTIRNIGLNGNSASTWTTAATLSGEYGTSFGVHSGELYLGTSIGKLYKWNGASFALQFTLTSGKPITSILSYNSKVYCGVSAT